jgi:hypothetical protein
VKQLLSELAQDILAEQAFIRRPALQDPTQPEPGYLQGNVVAYIERKTSEDDFPTLADMLERIANAEGLFYLANTYALSPQKIRRP